MKAKPLYSIKRSCEMRLSSLPLLLLGIVFISGPSFGFEELTPQLETTVSQALSNNDNAVIFHNALAQSPHWNSVETAEYVTLFVPTDAALKNEGSDFLLEIVLLKNENTDRLESLLAKHLVTAKRIDLKKRYDTIRITNDFGACVDIVWLSNTSLKILPEAIVTHHQAHKNGEIYYIDRLLWQHYKDSAAC